MARNERFFAFIVVAVVGVFVAVLATGAADALGQLGWFSNGANVIQWISGPATLAAVVIGVYSYWTRRCAVPWCPRYGAHKVTGTLKSVCVRHHTLRHHEIVHDLHAAAHALSEHLGWGESHNREEIR